VRLLLDTDALLWWLLDDAKLPAAPRDAIRQADTDVLVSAASAWEIATTHRLGKVPEAATDLPRLLPAARFRPLPVTVEHAVAAVALPGPHRDPFDRMLIAQAHADGLRVATQDLVFAAYGVDVLW